MKNVIYGFIAILAMGVAIATPFGLGATTIACSTGVVGAASLINQTTGIITIGLNKEIWIPQILEGFYADDSFIAEMRDMSAFVQYDIINLAEAGVNPEVLVNNTSYPIPFAQRADVPKQLPLDTYDTENTEIKSIETAELSYDKRESVLFGHRQALRMKFMEKAAQNIAPSTNTTYTPILRTTGADNGSGRRKMSYDDLLALESAFDEAEIPSEGRILVISTDHMKDLKAEDAKAYKDLLKDKSYAGFKIYKLAKKRLPRYNFSTGAKIAFQAAALSTDATASIAFHKDEVMRAQGTVDLFIREKDPETRSDIMGLQMRGLSVPIRNKAIAAIYAGAVA